jgi:glycosyltransferase involved in cell wall biosynthesis
VSAAAAVAASTSHVVVIPSYNSGALVYATVRAARAVWAPVWVVVDGSNDGTAAGLRELAAGDPQLRVEVLARNRGKGAAVLHALELAQASGFSHALTMDADGQHPAELIPAFMATSAQRAEAMVLGRPVFDASAPRLRVNGRRISNGLAWLETLGAGIDDSLYGFRVYPIAPLVAVMRAQARMRRFDFDPEAVVRLAWRGVPAINIAAPVKYLRAEDGGVSHFRYVRDNALLTWMNLRLLFGFVVRLPSLLLRRALGRPPYGGA